MISTVGDLRKALEKYDDKQSLYFIRIDDLTEAQQRESGFKQAIITHSVVDIRDDEIFEKEQDGSRSRVVTIQVEVEDDLVE